MGGFRIVAAGLAIAALSGGSAVESTVAAQASGTLQASVTVLDDLVSRAVREELAGVAAAPASAPVAKETRSVAGAEGIAATVTVLPRIGEGTVRVEVVYVN